MPHNANALNRLELPDPSRWASPHSPVPRTGGTRPRRPGSFDHTPAIPFGGYRIDPDPLIAAAGEKDRGDTGRVREFIACTGRSAGYPQTGRPCPGGV